MHAKCRISWHLVRLSWSKGIAHNKNEYMDSADLRMNLEIYMRSIKALTE